MGAVSHADRELVHVRLGDTSRRRNHGGMRPQRRRAHSERNRSQSVSRVVIVGAGHNGLTTAFYLAKAGVKPLVLERRSIVGGAAATEEIAPGFWCPSLAHAIGPLRASIIRDMRLEQRGVEFVRPDPRLVALSTEGRPLVFSSDERQTAEALRAFSSRDADRYGEFCTVLSRL